MIRFFLTHFSLLSKIILPDTVDMMQIFPSIKFPSRSFRNSGLIPKNQTTFASISLACRLFLWKICNLFGIKYSRECNGWCDINLFNYTYVHMYIIYAQVFSQYLDFEHYIGSAITKNQNNFEIINRFNYI